MLSKYTLKRINYKMFSKKISESCNQTQMCNYNNYFFIQNMLIFKVFVKTQSDQIYTKTHKTASISLSFRLQIILPPSPAGRVAKVGTHHPHPSPFPPLPSPPTENQKLFFRYIWYPNYYYFLSICGHFSNVFLYMNSTTCWGYRLSCALPRSGGRVRLGVHPPFLP